MSSPENKLTDLLFRLDFRSVWTAEERLAFEIEADLAWDLLIRQAYKEGLHLIRFPEIVIDRFTHVTRSPKELHHGPRDPRRFANLHADPGVLWGV